MLCQTKVEAERVLRYLQAWTRAAGLTLHPTKTRFVEAGNEGFDVLGWFIVPSPVFLSKVEGEDKRATETFRRKGDSSATF